MFTVRKAEKKTIFERLHDLSKKISSPVNIYGLKIVAVIYFHGKTYYDLASIFFVLFFILYAGRCFGRSSQKRIVLKYAVANSETL